MHIEFVVLHRRTEAAEINSRVERVISEISDYYIKGSISNCVVKQDGGREPYKVIIEGRRKDSPDRISRPYTIININARTAFDLLTMGYCTHERKVLTQR